MNEEIEYAEMLEIPLSTVNVVKKTTRQKKNLFSRKKIETAETQPLETEAPSHVELPSKETLIAQINDRLTDDERAPAPALEVDPALFAESVNSEGRLEFDAIPERVDTIRLYSDEEIDGFFENHFQKSEEMENEGSMSETKSFFSRENLLQNVLNAEFILSCALCGAIFLTNVFMPGSAINTFFRAITSTTPVATDTRTYADFTLAPVVSELSNAELSLSASGILSFVDECCVYPSADGTVAEVRKTEDGFYSLKLQYSDSFTGVIHGLNQVYYDVGDTVKKNVPVGYSEGEGEVQVTMYSNGELLNCFTLTEENCLAWMTENE